MKPTRVIGSGIAAILGMIGGVWMLQDRLIYFPAGDPGPAPGAWEDLTVETEDGLTLSSWMRIDEETVDGPLIVVFPGNGGNRSVRLPLGNELVRAGYGVVLTEYRGYGGNPGRPGETGLMSDARATVHAARSRGYGKAGVVYFGESLGAAVAIGVAALEPPDALVLGSPFTSLVDVGRYHYPWLPVTTVIRDRYASLERIRRGDLDDVPTIVLGGTADETVPFEQSREIADALGASMHEVRDAGHNDPALRSSPSMVRVVAAFVDSVLGS